MPKSVWDKIAGEEAEAIVFRRPLQESVDFDITPMIDVTFLLLIFFLVTSAIDVGKAVELPPARFGKGMNPSLALVITVAYQGEATPPAIYLADGKVGSPLSENAEQQRSDILAAVRESVSAGKPRVLLKAERKVKHKDIARILEIINEVPDVSTYIAVFERD
ncbi:MAG: biopolymer transporter ExbD [Thermogutta sp.]|nr:biopolymer transporter ExbD [Thermogutta sp.]HOP76334.1 biopolymer transporter ExbD [Thermogutta sp.]HPU07178.1 biopolymer transporter ExbD [Thermogutta sp.]HQF14070.1 biopolymer transporter ExbD [Thermogutta sp.]